jgi:hypothetical protein
MICQTCRAHADAANMTPRQNAESTHLEAMSKQVRASVSRGRAVWAFGFALVIGLWSGHPALAQETEAAATGLANARAALVGLEERYTELESANREFSEKIRELEKLNKDLAAGNAQLKHTLQAGNIAAKKFSANMSRRVFRNVSRHVAAMPAVSIPYVGAGVTAAMTALDIRDGCEGLRELNEMNRAMQLDLESEAPVCSMQVGSREEIINQVIANWRTAYAVAAAWTNQYETWLSPQPVTVSPARAAELWVSVFGTLPAQPAQTLPAMPRLPMDPVPPVAPNRPNLLRPY